MSKPCPPESTLEDLVAFARDRDPGPIAKSTRISLLSVSAAGRGQPGDSRSVGRCQRSGCRGKLQRGGRKEPLP